jgi:uncharacterized protein YuzB (UPF0349 family)
MVKSKGFFAQKKRGNQMNTVTVAFCTANLLDGAIDAYNQLKGRQYPNMTMRAEACLGYCGRCANTFFALVNKEVVEGATSEELLANIIDRISDQN